jgi:hypothetical protein
MDGASSAGGGFPFTFFSFLPLSTLFVVRERDHVMCLFLRAMFIPEFAGADIKTSALCLLDDHVSQCGRTDAKAGLMTASQDTKQKALALLYKNRQKPKKAARHWRRIRDHSKWHIHWRLLTISYQYKYKIRLKHYGAKRKKPLPPHSNYLPSPAGTPSYPLPPALARCSHAITYGLTAAHNSNPTVAAMKTHTTTSSLTESRSVYHQPPLSEHS